MKSVHPLGDDRPEAPISSTTLQPPPEDEVRQEQMRRLHNTRARQRAARHQRAGRPLM